MTSGALSSTSLWPSLRPVGASVLAVCYVLAADMGFPPGASQPSRRPAASVAARPNVDPCSGLVQDLLPHPMTPLAAPALGEAVVDPQLHGTIRRITRAPLDWKDQAVIIPMYSTIQSWNADESKLILWTRAGGGLHILFDGKTYEPIRGLQLFHPTDIEHVLWDPEDPDILYYPSNYNAIPDFYRYRVSTDKNELVHHFDFCPTGDWARLLSLGSDPTYMSWGRTGGKVVGLRCGDVKFIYDIASDSVLGQQVIPAAQNAPQPGPSGSLFYFYGQVLDRSLQATRVLLPPAGAIEHADLGSSMSGHDVYNTVVFDPPQGTLEKDQVGTLVSFDMVTGARKVIVGEATGYPYPPTTTHISSVATKRPGLVAVSAVGDPASQCVLCGEILLANVDTGKVCRVAHHHSYAGEVGPKGVGRWGYWAEPHVTLSPSGTRVLFGSDWDDGPSVDTYVVELPGYAQR